MSRQKQIFPTKGTKVDNLLKKVPWTKTTNAQYFYASISSSNFHQTISKQIQDKNHNRISTAIRRNNLSNNFPKKSRNRQCLLQESTIASKKTNSPKIKDSKAHKTYLQSKRNPVEREIFVSLRPLLLCLICLRC